MSKIFVINDFDDINDLYVRHYSLDKGHFMAKSLVKLGHTVYFLTTKENYNKNEINYICLSNVTTNFVHSMNYILIIREPLMIDIINKLPAIKSILKIPIVSRNGPKFIIKSDCPFWYRSKAFIKSLRELSMIGPNEHITDWVIAHIDFICAQNKEYAAIVRKYNIKDSMILVSKMGIPNEAIDFSKLINPYCINHLYCVDNPTLLEKGKALWPYYYTTNPSKKPGCNSRKYIIVYTGRIKTDGGKIFYNMRDIMKILGDKYELHIFPGSFSIPNESGVTHHSSKNALSLDILRNTIYKDSTNVIVHFPYEHTDKYRYLYYADCGIDFSDTRPAKVPCIAGHAKILEYCESGLPIVCEENIQNLSLIKNGGNGIILPYMASDQQYAQAIKEIVIKPINRKHCRDITRQNENWDTITADLINQINSKIQKT